MDDQMDEEVILDKEGGSLPPCDDKPDAGHCKVYTHFER
jgi:hypothetical protein